LTNYENIIMYNQLDCYNIVMHSNMHMTLYSSCVLEVLSFGIPNILLDIKGFSTLYYNKLLDVKYSKIVSNDSDFFDAVDDCSKLKKEDIINNNIIFKENYEKNIFNFLSNYLKEGNDK